MTDPQPIEEEQDQSIMFMDSTSESISAFISEGRVDAVHNRIRNTGDRIGRRRESFKSIGRAERPSSIWDIDGMISLCKNMQEKTDALSRLSADRAALNELESELQELNSSSLSTDQYKVNINEVNKQLEGMFSSQVVFVSQQMSENFCAYRMRISEHVVKPCPDSLHVSRVANGHGSDWLRDLKSLGASRPPIEFILGFHVYSNHIQSPKILIPVNDFNLSNPDVFLSKAGGCGRQSILSALNEEVTPNFRRVKMLGGKPHPHVRFGREVLNEYCASSCLGSYERTIIRAIRSGDPLSLASICYSYMTRFDLADPWGNDGSAIYHPRLIPEGEVERPIWTPMFIMTSEGVLEFIEKPVDFDYNYTVFFVKSDGQDDMSCECSTDITFVADEDQLRDCDFIKVVTDQSKSFMITLSRRSR